MPLRWCQCKVYGLIGLQVRFLSEGLAICGSRFGISELKRRFCQHERHAKIGITNFGAILHHSARVRKQETLKIFCHTVCVEDYLKLTQTQFLIQSPLGNLTSC